MKRFFAKIFPLAAILFFAVFIPALSTQAATPCPPPSPTQGVFGFYNPICAGDAVALIESVVKQVQPFAITIIVFIIILQATKYIYAVSAGGENATAAAKKHLLPALYAAVIIAGALVFVHAVVLFAQGFK